MFENIKSKYIIKIILDLLNEKRKLIIIKYNKGLKIKSDITKYHYMKYSGKYIKYKSKTKVKEYDLDDNVIFIFCYIIHFSIPLLSI